MDEIVEDVKIENELAVYKKTVNETADDQTAVGRTSVD